MTSLPRIIAALEPIDNGWRVAVPEIWLQGRTAYGGFSSALALAAAQRLDEQLPPLRSAQIAFIGPLYGDVTIHAHELRRGRNAVWVQAEVASDAGLGLRAMFVFMREQSSRIDHSTSEPAPVPTPGENTPTLSGPEQVAFTRNFEFIDAPPSIAGPAEWLRWVRLRERAGLDAFVELIAVADCLPLAALRLTRGPAPVSSMTWQIDLLGQPAAGNGWHLLRAQTDHARDGVSSQRMAVWNGEGVQVAAQMQSVALFA